MIDESERERNKNTFALENPRACNCFPEHASTSIDLQSLLVALPLVLPWPMKIRQLREDVCHPVEFKLNLRSLHAMPSRVSHKNPQKLGSSSSYSPGLYYSLYPDGLEGSPPEQAAFVRVTRVTQLFDAQQGFQPAESAKQGRRLAVLHSYRYCQTTG